MASGNSEHRRDCYHLIFIIYRCALSANQSATAGALDPVHWTGLTLANLQAMQAMDRLSYFNIRSLMGSRIADEEFVKSLSTQRQLPTTPFVNMIWRELANAPGAPRLDNGQLDPFRDVSEICDVLFERKNLPSFIRNIYNGPLVLRALNVASAHGLQDLIDQTPVSDNPTTVDERWTEGALQAFEIAKCTSGSDNAFVAACTYPFVSGLGTQAWVKSEATRILALAPALLPAGKGKAKPSKAIYAKFVQEAIQRQSMGFVFKTMYPAEVVENFDNSRDMPELMMDTIASYGIRLAVTLALTDRGVPERLTDAVRACIPQNLLEKYPSPHPINQVLPRAQMDFATAIRVLVVLHAICVGDEYALMPDHDRQQALNILFANQYGAKLRSSSPDVILPENMTVTSNGVAWTIRSIILLSGSHFTTRVFSSVTGGPASAPTVHRYMTRYDDLRSKPSRLDDLPTNRTFSNVVRVICSRQSVVRLAPTASAAGGLAVRLAPTAEEILTAAIGCLAAPTVGSLVVVSPSASAAVGLTASAAVGLTVATPSKTVKASDSAAAVTVAVKAVVKANMATALSAVQKKAHVVSDRVSAEMEAIRIVAMPKDNVLGRIEVRSSETKNLGIFRLECEMVTVYKKTGGATKDIFSEDKKRRFKLIESQGGTKWTEVGFAVISSDNWEATLNPKADLSEWSLPFTQKKKCDMRLHHIFITLIFEYIRRVYVKALCADGRVMRLDAPNIPKFQLHFDIGPDDLFEGAVYADRDHLRKWGEEKTALWDENELFTGWDIPPLIDEKVYRTVSNYQNPTSVAETLAIIFVM